MYCSIVYCNTIRKTSAAEELWLEERPQTNLLVGNADTRLPTAERLTNHHAIKYFMVYIAEEDRQKERAQCDAIPGIDDVA